MSVVARLYLGAAHGPSPALTQRLGLTSVSAASWLSGSDCDHMCCPASFLPETHCHREWRKVVTSELPVSTCGLGEARLTPGWRERGHLHPGYPFQKALPQEWKAGSPPAWGPCWVGLREDRPGTFSQSWEKESDRWFSHWPVAQKYAT